MPSVFLSYSRADLPLIEHLETQLKSHPEISIWRDQEKIYGRQKWPKVLGEAIADQDICLLAWSRHAAASPFVEFECTTALVLKKPVIPCRVDTVALPPALRAIHALPVNDSHTIEAAITGASLIDDAKRRAEVVGKLDQIKDTEPEAVVKAASTLFDQRGSSVQGNVIQGEHVTVHVGGAAKLAAKGLAEKWQTWVGILVGILTALTLMIELPKKMKPGLPLPSTPASAKAEREKPTFGTLGGLIRGESDGPLEGVQVSLPQFNPMKTTDSFGQFRFDVTPSNQETVALLTSETGLPNLRS